MNNNKKGIIIRKDRNYKEENKTATIIYFIKVAFILMVFSIIMIAALILVGSKVIVYVFNIHSYAPFIK